MPSGSLLSLGARSAPLRYLITQAFEIEDYQLFGTSGWVESELYAIRAAAGKQVNRSELMAMLRNMLVERFRLKVHHEIRSVRVYALVVDKNGAKLNHVGQRSDGRSGERMSLPVGTTMQDLVRTLNLATGPSALGRPVVDRTGLRGIYNIWLTYDNEMKSDGKGGRLSIDYFSALPSQLGLRLSATTAAVDGLVVDSATKAQSDE